jgi:O-antigen/teichoic acid export membrane protein
MTLVDYYLIFALATAFAAMLELFLPVVNAVAVTHAENNVIQYKTLTLSTLFIMALVFAPLIFPACIIPSFDNRFCCVLTSSESLLIQITQPISR